MIFTITPITDTMIEEVSITQFLTYNGIITCILVMALILRELLDSSAKENPHHKHLISSLDIAIYPLFFIFLMTTAYKVIEVLYL